VQYSPEGEIVNQQSPSEQAKPDRVKRERCSQARTSRTPRAAALRLKLKTPDAEGSCHCDRLRPEIVALNQEKKNGKSTFAENDISFHQIGSD
jgi:hypothetical protein